MSGPTIVELTGVSKRFSMNREKSLKEQVAASVSRRRRTKDFWALRDVDLAIEAGTTVGLIGANGSGKSTLLKVIGAIIEPTTGTVRRRGRLAALLELGAGFHQDLTGRENVYLNAAILGMTKAETDRQFDAIVDFSGIEPFIDTQVKFYSSGMYVRLAFAVAVHVDPDLLLVDEVLAVGDEPFQLKCMERIRAFQNEGRTIALVSHSADQVGDLCDRAVLLRHGRVVVDGEPAEGIRALRQGFDNDRREHEAAHSDIPRLGRVSEVLLLDGDGEPTAELHPGDPLAIRVTVDLEERVGPWHVALALETPRGQYVVGTTTKRLELPLPEEPGQHTVTFDMPSVRLGTGGYVVRVRVSADDGRTIDLVTQAALVSVLGSDRYTGLVDMPMDAKVES